MGAGDCRCFPDWSGGMVGSLVGSPVESPGGRMVRRPVGGLVG